jgi:hypothetical protein
MTIWGHPKGFEDLHGGHTPGNKTVNPLRCVLESDVYGKIPNEVIVAAVGGRRHLEQQREVG